MADGGPQMCTVDDLVPDEGPCLRVAQWTWHPAADDHPVHLCHFHAEPLMPASVITDG